MKFNAILLAQAAASVTSALPSAPLNGGGLKSQRLSRRQENEKPALRILPFGASIVSGYGASDGAGLRKVLRTSLINDGFDVTMVGSQASGDMPNNEHEAVPGDLVSMLAARVPIAVQYKPNVVIINIGTNDANLNVDPATAGNRLRGAVENLWAGEDMEDTCIFVSTLIPTGIPEGVKNRPSMNQQYRDLVSDLAKTGKCIHLADMAPGSNDLLVIPDDFDPNENPHVHPNDKGHQKMASVFYNAITQAADDIKPAAGSSQEPIAQPTDEPTVVPTTEPIAETTIAPITEPAVEPTTEPVVEVPDVEVPDVDEPVGEEPVDEQPVDEQPTDEEPVDEQPVEDEPVDEEPIIKDPTAEDPVADPILAPIVDPVTLPVTEPATETITEPVAQPTEVNEQPSQTTVPKPKGSGKPCKSKSRRRH